jgi:hypothetical protein
MHSQVICEKADKTDIPTIDKKKYLVPSVSIHIVSLETVKAESVLILRESLDADRPPCVRILRLGNLFTSSGRGSS